MRRQTVRGRPWRLGLGAAMSLALFASAAPLTGQDAEIRAVADLTLTDASTGRAITKRGTTSRPGEQLPEMTPEAFTSQFALVVPPSEQHRTFFAFHCQVGWGSFETLPAVVNGITVRSFGALGHDHAGTPPKGSWSPATGPTDANRQFWTTYSAPPISVNESLTVDYTFNAPGHVCNGYRFNITWAISARGKGLVPLALARFVKAEPIGHGHNQVLYVTPDMSQRVGKMAESYYMQTRRLLRVHTASLPQGGLFDVNGDYAAPWSDHQKGTEIDVSGGVTEDVVNKLIQAGASAGLTCTQKGPTIVHCASN